MFLICSLVLASNFYDQGREFGTHLLEKTKQELKEEVKTVKNSRPAVSGAVGEKKKCLTQKSPEASTATRVLVFISFSVPETVWLSLSEEVTRINGTFVIRGLPNNSFKELAHCLYQLRKKGMKTSVQIDPKAFNQFAVKQVPTFVVRNEKDQKFNKLSGNVSLSFALQKMGGL